MKDDSVEFHLRQARLHLEQALTATKLQASNGALSLQEPSVDFHLREALSHLDAALNKSILHVQADTSAKKEVGQQWERFSGIFSAAREKEKQSELNLWSWVAFPRIC